MNCALRIARWYGRSTPRAEISDLESAALEGLARAHSSGIAAASDFGAQLRGHDYTTEAATKDARERDVVALVDAKLKSKFRRRYSTDAPGS